MKYSYISNNKYIAKDKSNELAISRAREDLTVTNPEYEKLVAFGKGRYMYSKIPKTLKFYKEDENYLIVPRNYKADVECRDLTNPGKVIKVKSNIVLRDYQKKYIYENNLHLRNNTDKVIQMPCGTGKTILTIWLSVEVIKRVTVVVVPTIYLANQWIDSIRNNTDAVAYLWKSTDKEIPLDADFYVLTMDLLSVRELPQELLDVVGHVVFDECHRTGAEKYFPILERFASTWRTALTATFRREDGMHRMLEHYFGEKYVMPQQFEKPRVYGLFTGINCRHLVSKNVVSDSFKDWMDKKGIAYKETDKMYKLDRVSPLWEGEVERLVKLSSGTQRAYFKDVLKGIKSANDINFSVTESYLSSDLDRRKIMEDLIRECYNKGRTILFLSKRKDTLRYFAAKFASLNPALLISETNKMNRYEKEEIIKNCRLIFGINQIVKEGFDKENLDTLILDLPIKDTEQAIGRIARYYEGKKSPIVFYPVDDNPVMYSLWQKAKKWILINGKVEKDIIPSQIADVI